MMIRTPSLVGLCRYPPAPEFPFAHAVNRVHLTESVNEARGGALGTIE